MNKFINFVAEIFSILLVSIVFAFVVFYVLRSIHFFSEQQIENVAISASLVVSFFGCVVVDKSKKAAQL